MCGIAGILTFDGRPVAACELEALTHSLAHRGRDGDGFVRSDPDRGLPLYPGVGLGHRRLAVIDLSPDADQPMSYAGRFWISYNGELYNFEPLREELARRGHHFRTASDTEVVLAAYAEWGTNCLERFNGMFAFAIWDETERTLFCARDAIGIKPFYYTLDENAFRFASEARALASPGPRPHLDLDALRSYVLGMYVPGPLSLFAGVKKLPPGHFMRLRPNRMVEMGKYWQTPPCASDTIDAPAAASALCAQLDRSVAMQLRSDVPVGALLSGGFDSGMVVASAAQRQTLHTYTVGFDSADQLDELPIARALANRYGTKHHERVIRPEETVGLLDRALASMSEPVADSAIVPTYVLAEMAAADGVKVLLSGTGGDEVFAGYPRYIGSSRARRLLLSLPDQMRRLLARAVSGRAALSARLRHRTLDMLMTTGGSPAVARFLFEDEASFGRYLESLVQNVLPAESNCDADLYRHMEFDLRVYLPDLLLVLLDQLTMAHTVEGRVPLLDVDLVAASYRLPPSLHATATETKRLMRQMAADRLVSGTLTAPKQGFSGPVTRWIRENRETFRERTIAVRGLPGMKKIPVEHLWRQEGSNPRWAGELFSLFCLSTWYYGAAV